MTLKTLCSIGLVVALCLVVYGVAGYSHSAGFIVGGLLLAAICFFAGIDQSRSSWGSEE